MKIIPNDLVCEVDRIIIKKKEQNSMNQSVQQGFIKTVRIKNGEQAGKFAIFESGSIQDITARGYNTTIARLKEVLTYIELEADEDFDYAQ